MKKILLCIVLLLQINTALAITISGDFFRPENSLGNESDLVIELTLTPSQGSIVFIRDFRITIPAGQDSVPFSVTNNFSAPSYTLKYSCSSFFDGQACATENYILPGYYTENGTTGVEENARNFTETDDDLTSIEFTAIRSEILTGTMNRPSGSDLSRLLGGSITFSQKDENGIFRQAAFADVEFPAGINSVDFTIRTDSVREDDEIIVSYSCFANCSPIISPAYYRVNNTVIEQEDAQLFSLAELQSTSIDFTLLAPFMVSGNLIRPEGFDQNTRLGLRANLLILNDNGDIIGSENDFSAIEAGENSSTFSLRRKSSEDLEVIVSYSCSSDCDGIASPGYYNSSGTVVSISDAQRFEIDGSDNARNSVQNINITALETNQLSGVLKRPDSNNNTQSIIPSLTLTTYDSNYNLINTSSQNIVISSGSPESPFSFDIIPDENRLYELRYSCNSCDDILTDGWYNSQGGQPLQQNSEVLFGSNDLTAINFEMASPESLIEISGQFRTTGLNVDSLEPVRITITASIPLDETTEVSEQIIQLASSESTPFTIQIPELPNAQYSISYSCITCQAVSSNGFFSLNGTQSNSNNAGSFSISEIQSLGNIIFDALVPNTITGSITRANGGPTGSALSVNVRAVSVDDNFFSQENITIPANSTSVTYSLDVSTDRATEYIVSYICNNCNGYIEFGFFSDTGSTIDEERASPVTASGNANILLLRSQTVNGQLSLPSNFTLASNQRPVVNVHVISSNASSNTVETGLDTFVFNPNFRSGNFSIDVPMGSEYSINYTCFNDCTGLVELGQYNRSLGRAVDRATPIFITPANISQNANFSMLVEEPTSIEDITITITRPNSVSTNTGFSGFVELESFNNSGSRDETFGQFFEFEPNQTSTTLDLSINTTAKIGYELNYNCFDCDGIIQDGYYISNNVSSAQSSDAEFITDLNSLNNSNFSLVPSAIFTGNIFRPQNSDINEAITVELNLINIDIDDNFSFFGSSTSKEVIIPAQESSVEYALSSSKQLNSFSIISYTLDCGINCTENGFFHSDGTVDTFIDAERIQAKPLNDNLDFTILNKERVEIRGLISRPTGLDNSESISVDIDAFALTLNGSHDDIATARVIIPDGQASAEFSFLVDEDILSSILFRYDCSFCQNIVDTAYHNESGGTIIRDEAQTIGELNFPNSINIELIESTIITGQLIRVNGIPANRIEPSISVALISETGEEISVTRSSVRIFSTEESKNFTLFVPPATEGQSYRLSYSCFNFGFNSDCEGISESGFYNSDKTTVFISQAQTLTNQDITEGILFELLPSETISGTISRSDFSSTDRPIRLTLEVSSFDPGSEFGDLFTPRTFRQLVVIPPGQESTDYSIDVSLPTNIYTLSYSCSNSGTDNNCQNFLREGFYANSTVVDSELNAELLNNEDNDLSNINFSIIESNGKNLIEVNGTILRPENDDISINRFIEVEIETVGEDGFRDETINLSVEIPQNQTSTTFSTNIEPSSSYRVSYSCSANCNGVAREGFYSLRGTEPNIGFTQPLSNTDVSNIEFELLATKNFIGEIRRPVNSSNPRTLPIRIIVEAFTDEDINFFSEFEAQTIVLARSQNSKSFSIPIVVSDRYNYSAQYICQDPTCDGFSITGFYSSSDTSTPVIESREFWSFDEPFNNRNLTLIETRELTGTVYTPGQSESESFYSINVIARPVNNDNDGSLIYIQNVTILPGQTSAEYSINVPELSSGGYIISYSCISCDSIIDRGFYNNEGTTPNLGQASRIPNIISSNIDLELISEVTISGTIELPENTISINGGFPESILFRTEQVLAVTVKAELLDAQFNIIDIVTEKVDFFVELDSSGNFSIGSKIRALVQPFSLSFQDGIFEHVRLSYECNNCDNVLTVGYYRNEGGSVESQEEAQLLDSINTESIRLTLIPDSDNDGISDINDNCVIIANPDQSDLDQDLIGDLCDGDMDNDNVPDVIDNCPTVFNPNQNINACEAQDEEFCFLINSKQGDSVTICL